MTIDTWISPLLNYTLPALINWLAPCEHLYYFIKICWVKAFSQNSHNLNVLNLPMRKWKSRTKREENCSTIFYFSKLNLSSRRKVISSGNWKNIRFVNNSHFFLLSDVFDCLMQSGEKIISPTPMQYLAKMFNLEQM